ncbi:hypothetical protein [Sandaracinobacteroides hominis]|uniref:hypothetical protein n=1 Tax=Sandaracinobacteroides hominis TaxID=2780086 RepID=UPI0018F57D0D|nr:hypothetical protein [Sandaracinobacteroides hominis]
MAYGVGEKIGIGRVLSNGFLLLRQNAVPFLILGFVFYGFPGLAAAAVRGFPTATQQLQASFGAAYFVPLLLTLVGSLVALPAMLRFLGEKRAGETPELGGMLLEGLKLAPATFAVLLLHLLASMVGWLFLLVPGIIIYIMFCVSLPVLTEERAGVTGSLKRSRELTKGSRWRIFLLLLIGWLVLMVISAPIYAAVFLSPDSGVLNALISAAANTIFLPLSATMLASLYFELKDVREGAGTETLAEIFA